MFLKSFIGWMPPKLDKAKRDLGGRLSAGFYRSPPNPFSSLFSNLSDRHQTHGRNLVRHLTLFGLDHNYSN